MHTKTTRRLLPYLFFLRLSFTPSTTSVRQQWNQKRRANIGLLLLRVLFRLITNTLKSWEKDQQLKEEEGTIVKFKVTIIPYQDFFYNLIQSADSFTVLIVLKINKSDHYKSSDFLQFYIFFNFNTYCVDVYFEFGFKFTELDI